MTIEFNVLIFVSVIVRRVKL